jgi:hypothetical protein
MPFPNTHLYLTLHWIVQGASGESGQCGLRFDNTGNLTQQMVTDCASAVSTMWQSAGAGIESGYQLQYLRLAKIGTDGKYFPGSVSFDHIYSSPPAGGGGATTARFPLQVALATTLLTAIPRGQANKGRIYLPWPNAALGNDALFPVTSANTRSSTVATMITALNVILGPCNVFSKGTKTSTAGAKHVVTGVKTGRRPDVQRRRAKQVAEIYGTTSTVS